jgi:hypothetical protein
VLEDHADPAADRAQIPHLSQCLDAPRVDAERLDMDGGDHREPDSELRLLGAVIRDVLEEIRVRVAVAQERLRPNVTADLDHPHGKVGGEVIGDVAQDLRIGHR